MEIDLANQTKGILAKAKVEDLSTIESNVGTLSGFKTSLDSAAVVLGYIDFTSMIGYLVLQIEANRVASGAAPVAGYRIPPPIPPP